MTTPTLAGPHRKPYDEEIDVYGLTHTGKVRKENQAQFLICALKKQLVVRQTSLPELHTISPEPERLAFLMLAAAGAPAPRLRADGGRRGRRRGQRRSGEPDGGPGGNAVLRAHHALLLCRPCG